MGPIQMASSENSLINSVGLELCSFRLMRFFKYFGSNAVKLLISKLFLLIKSGFVIRYPQIPAQQHIYPLGKLFLNAEILIVKGILYLSNNLELLYDILLANKDLLCYMGETSKRAILVAVSRFIKSRQFVSTCEQLKKWKEWPRHLPQQSLSKNVIEHLPLQLKNIYLNPPRSQLVTKNLVEKHASLPFVQNVLSGLKTLNSMEEVKNAAENLRDIYAANPENKIFFLCAVWQTRSTGWLRSLKERKDCYRFDFFVSARSSSVNIPK